MPVLQLQLGSVTLDLLNPATGVIANKVDLGYPVVREVKASIPTRDGSYDTTSLIGDRVVTIDGTFLQSDDGTLTRQQGVDALMPFLAPHVRPRLVVQVDTEPSRFVTLRASAQTGPHISPTFTTFTASWVAPDPIFYGLGQERIFVYPGTRKAGRTYPLAFPRQYAVAGVGAVGVAVNHGSYQTWPTFTIYGPCTDPVIQYAPAPGYIAFKGLSVVSGDFVVVDTQGASTLYNGQASRSVYSLLDFTQTVWAPLQPGSTELFFLPASSTPATFLQVDWYDAYL